MLRLTSVVAVLLLAAPVRSDDPEKGPPANDLLADGLAKAKKDDKQVFLVFGTPGCVWCKYLEKFHADPAVAKVVGKYFVIVKVDLVTNPGGEELYRKYGTDRGVPAWTILDANSKVVADSGDGQDNVGFPYEPHEVEHYVKVVRKAAPAMTDAEAELLVAKLREIGPKKNKDKDN
jgi:thiol-disulfide isomerase/thioredoxin